MNPEEYIEFWNSYIDRWYTDMRDYHIRSLEIWDDFFRQYPFNITDLMYHRYFPEPYFGNPQSNNLQAVFINLNPGQARKEQDSHPGGKLLTFYRASNRSYYKLMRVLIHYSKINRVDSIMGPTIKWWENNRVNWVNQTFISEDQANVTLDNIVGLELTPWHTKSFREIESTLSSENLDQYVFAPAASISKRVLNPYLRSKDKSIVIGRGLQGVLAVQDLLDFKPCTTTPSDHLTERWNIRRANIDDKTILIDFTKKRGGFGMKLPISPELKDFFAAELQTI